MADKKYFWLKLKDNFFDAAEIRFIEEQENGPQYIIFWQKLLLLGIRQQEPGILRFKDSIPYDVSILASVTHVNIDIVRVAMGLFRDLEMLEVRSNGDIWIEQVNELVGSETAAAARMRGLRTRKKAIDDKRNIVTKTFEHSDRELELELEKDINAQKDCAGKYSADFESLWSLYPKKVEKKAAYKKYRAALKTTTLDNLVTAVTNYAKERKGQDQQYTQHPARFFDGSYEDYINPVSDKPERVRLWCPVCLQYEESTSPTCIDCGVDLIEKGKAE